MCAHSGAETHSKTGEARTNDTSGQGRKVGAKIIRIFGGFFHLVLIGQPMPVLFAVWSGNRMDNHCPEQNTNVDQRNIARDIGNDEIGTPINPREGRTKTVQSC